MVPICRLHDSQGTNVCYSLVRTLLLTSLRSDIEWPACSSDLALCEFFLSGYPKSFLYTNCARPLGVLKSNIRSAIAHIESGVVDKVDQNFLLRVSECFGQSGGHRQDTIFRMLLRKL